MFGRSGKKGNYAYTVARVKAKKALLFKREDYEKMLMMSVPEISRYISESSYQKDMIALAGKFEGMDLLEHALNQSMANIFQDLILASQGDLKLMVAAYLKKFDFTNFKTILRGKSYGLDADGIRADLIPAGKLSPEALDTIIACEEMDDVLNTFCGLAHVKIPAEVSSAARLSKNRGVIEDHLDRMYYTGLIATINPNSRPAAIFLNYIKHEIDLKNLETILKLKSEGLAGESIMTYFIPGGREVDQRTMLQFANAASLEEVFNEMSQLSFYEDIKATLEGKTTVSEITTAMSRYHLEESKKFSHLYPLSVIPVLDFIIHKEIEVSNIRIIARGIESKLDKESIEKLLVI